MQHQLGAYVRQHLGQIAANRDFARFRGTTEKELIGWLRQILATNLANVVRQYHDTKGRDIGLERELLDDLAESSRVLGRSVAADESSPSQRAARREREVLVADSIGQLPEDYRDVVILRHLEGLKFREVAARMDRTVGSVEKLWVRALVTLRHLLRDME